MNLNLTNRRTLVQSLPKNYKVGVEVGVRTGWFAKFILENTDLYLHCVDPWVENPQLGRDWEEIFILYSFLTHPFQDRRNTIREWSPKAADYFKDNSLDFVYIDAEHTYEAVKLDMPAWWKKVKIGGILAGHDYGWPTVKRAVDEFVAEYNSPLTARPNIQILTTGIVGNAKSSLTGDLGEFDGDQPSWVIVKSG